MKLVAPTKVFGPRSMRLFQFVIDLAIGLASVVLAYLIRFDAIIPESFAHQMLVMAPVIACARLLVYRLVGVYRVVWRYVGVREALLFGRAVLLFSGVLLALRLFSPESASLIKLPISIIILEAVFCYLGLTSSRLLRRIFHEAHRDERGSHSDAITTLLVGAGQNGLSIAKEALRHREALGILPVGFLDDDLAKTGMEVNGIKVMGTLDDVEEVIKRTAATQVIITSNAVSSKSIVKLIDACRPMDVQVRTVPGLLELLGKGLSAQSLRDVRIEDLLSRDPVPSSMSMNDLRALLAGKRIMVTGAGGSIGSELCRQLMALQPASLMLLERDENNLFEVHKEVGADDLSNCCVPILADVRDRKALDRVFKEHKPQLVFHAAAYKHVPMMERFPAESAKNNVFGTQNLAELADEHGVENFVMISTDKAVNPTSVMGATKRLAEIVIQRIAPTSKTHFSCVRFGNVLGSRGSVIPIFREQIRRGGPVTVTHPEATRYFMTIPEAANLVIQAGTLGDRGEVFLLDMGEPVKIIDLARQMIHLSGASEDKIKIKIMGSRPGEKLFEELKTDAEGISDTTLRKVFRVEPEAFDQASINGILSRIDFAVRAYDHGGVRAALEDLGIGFTKKPQRMKTSDPQAQN